MADSDRNAEQGLRRERADAALEAPFADLEGQLARLAERLEAAVRERSAAPIADPSPKPDRSLASPPEGDRHPNLTEPTQNSRATPRGEDAEELAPRRRELELLERAMEELAVIRRLLEEPGPPRFGEPTG
jgi:hypothetical protein